MPTEPAALAWSDSAKLAHHLRHRFPKIDPLTIRFPDLKQWVLATPGFDDPERTPNPKLLEAIQREWYGLFDE